MRMRSGAGAGEVASVLASMLPSTTMRGSLPSFWQFGGRRAGRGGARASYHGYRLSGELPIVKNSRDVDRLPGQWFQIETGLHYNWASPL